MRNLGLFAVAIFCLLNSNLSYGATKPTTPTKKVTAAKKPATRTLKDLAQKTMKFAPETPVPVVSSPVTPAAPPVCTYALAGPLAQVVPTAAQTDEFIREKRALEMSNNQAVSKQNLLVRTAKVKQMQAWERLMLLVSIGAKEEALQMVKDVAYPFTDSVLKITNILRAVEKTNQNSAQWVSLRAQFEKESTPFGQGYGTYDVFMRSLRSIQSGAGTNLNSVVTTLIQQGTNSTMSLDLRSPTAVDTADYILKVIDLNSERAWLPNAPQIQQPTIGDIEYLYRHNIFALLADLRSDNDMQTGIKSLWVRGIGSLANAFLATTGALTFIPENYRQSVLAIVGLAYDAVMQRQYLDKIQAVVSITRRLDGVPVVATATTPATVQSSGNIVISSAPELMDMQVKTLMELDSTGTNNDFFITFARLAYHTDVWVSLVNAVQAKANAEGSSSKYKNVLARMQDAETRAATMQTLPYIYPESYPAQLRLAVTTLALTALTDGTIEHFFSLNGPMSHVHALVSSWF